MRRDRSTALVAATLAIACAVTTPQAAEYPVRPVRLLVPTAPGGGTDNVVRIISPKVSQLLGQQLVVDNRAGAGGSIAARLAARSVPDGYTLLATFASHSSNPAVMKDTGYDLARDFTPISLTVLLPNILVAHPTLPAKDVKSLIALARAQPDKLQYGAGTYGASSHLSMALFNGLTNTRMVVVPYKGVGPALTGVMAGEVNLMIASMLSSLHHVRNRKLVAFGVTSAKRVNAAPEIPTIAEAGVPGYQADNWSGLLAPAGTPRPIVIKLHGAVVQALQDPALAKRFADEGAEAAPSRTPAEFGTMIRSEVQKWSKVAREAGIEPM